MATYTPKLEATAESATAPIEAFRDTMKSGEETQKQATSTLSEINSYWIARAKDETEGLATLVQSVVGKSPAAAMPLWQEWFSGRMQRASSDGKKLLEHSQTLMSSMMPKH